MPPFIRKCSFHEGIYFHDFYHATALDIPLALSSKHDYTGDMEEAEVIDLIREAIMLSIEISAPVMVIGLVVGTVVALIQALTQIQEVTLVFVPKILAIFFAIFVGLPMMSVALVEFMTHIADRIVAIK